MKQIKISKQLKLLTFLLAFLSLIFFCGMSMFEISENYIGLYKHIPVSLAFTWYTAILCFAVLFKFYKVTIEIGKDNSFSLENRDSFHQMGLLGIAASIGFFCHMIYAICFLPGLLSVTLFVFIFLILLSLIFYGLCEALSKLIENAYNVKLENELTI